MFVSYDYFIFSCRCMELAIIMYLGVMMFMLVSYYIEPRTKNQDQMGLNNRYYLILSGYLIRLIISLWQLIPVLLNHDPERVS